MQYLQELFAQKTPYLQWLEQQEAELDRQYGQMPEEKRTVPGKRIHRLPFSSCTDSIENDADISGETVCLFVKEGGTLSDYAEIMVSEVFSQNNEAVLVYADEDYKGSLETLYGITDDTFAGIGYPCGSTADYRGAPWFKPDFSPDTLASFFYVGSIFAVRGMLCEGYLQRIMAETGSRSAFMSWCTISSWKPCGIKGTVSCIFRKSCIQMITLAAQTKRSMLIK